MKRQGKERELKHNDQKNHCLKQDVNEHDRKILCY